MSGVDRFNDDAATRLRSAALALWLLAATVGRVVEEVEDPAARGSFVLPPLERPAVIGAGPVGLALEALLPRRELGWVTRQLVVGGGERVRLLLGPSIPVVRYALVGGDDFPLVRARRTSDALLAGQGSTCLWPLDLHCRS